MIRGRGRPSGPRDEKARPHADNLARTAIVPAASLILLGTWATPEFALRAFSIHYEDALAAGTDHAMLVADLELGPPAPSNVRDWEIAADPHRARRGHPIRRGSRNGAHAPDRGRCYHRRRITAASAGSRRAWDLLPI